MQNRTPPTEPRKPNPEPVRSDPFWNPFARTENFLDWVYARLTTPWLNPVRQGTSAPEKPVRLRSVPRGHRILL